MPELVTFGDLKNRVAARVGAARPQDVTRIAEYCIESLRDFWRRNEWPERRRYAVLRVPALIEAKADFIKGSADVTLINPPLDSAAWPVGNVGWQMVPSGLNNPPYEILEVNAGNPAECTLARPYLGEDATQLDVIIYQDRLPLPSDCAEVLTEDISLLDNSGIPIRWQDRLSSNWNFTYANTKARPAWATYGDHYIDPTTGAVNRTVRIGPGCADADYDMKLGYKNVYPGGSEDTDPLMIPPDRRDIPMWGALMRAYSEPPWLNETDALQMNRLYENAVGIADATEHEGDSDLFVMDGYDEGNLW